jgi:hypothetical protein
MPSKSPEQHRAMQAAKAGHSTLGIPQKVGAEFVKADKQQSGAKAAAKARKGGGQFNLPMGKRK